MVLFLELLGSRLLTYTCQMLREKRFSRKLIVPTSRQKVCIVSILQKTRKRSIHEIFLSDEDITKYHKKTN